jgi:hypothetical protein
MSQLAPKIFIAPLFASSRKALDDLVDTEGDGVDPKTTVVGSGVTTGVTWAEVVPRIVVLGDVDLITVGVLIVLTTSPTSVQKFRKSEVNSE